MKNKIKHTILSLLIIGFYSCKKEKFPEDTPDQETLTSVFTTSGTINGQEFLFEAGKNEIVLTTAYQEGFEGDYYLTSKFINHNCPECYPQLKVNLKTNTGIYFDNEFTEENIRVDSFLYTNSNIDLKDRIVKTPTNVNENINFVVVNGNYTNLDDFHKMPSTEPVILDYTYHQGNIEIDNDHWYSYNTTCESSSQYHTCVFGLEYDNPAKLLTITPPDFGVLGVYSWVINWIEDGEIHQKISSDNTPFENELDYEIDFYNINMLFESESGDVIIQRQNHIEPTFDSFIVAPITFDMLNVQPNTRPTIDIEYINEEGVTYTSSNVCNIDFHQNNVNLFKITEVANYDNNANGDKNLLVKFNSSIELISEEGDILIIEDFSGTIAFAIPEE